MRLLAVLMFVSSPAAAAELVTRAAVDLDGDGRDEKIELVAPPEGSDAPFTLTAGDARLKEKISFDEGLGFRVVDIAASDKQKELLIVGPSSSDFYTLLFVRYAKGNLQVIGRLAGQMPHGEPEISGAGFVLTDVWQGFWRKREKLVPDAKGTLAPLAQELYDMNVTAKVKTMFPIAASRAKGAAILARLKPGSEITLVAYDASPACKPGDRVYEPCDLILVRSSSGLLGWVTIEVLDQNVELPWAG